MVLCFDCAECNRDLVTDMMNNRVDSSRGYKCKAGKFFKYNLLADIDFDYEDSVKFEDIECQHFHPIDFSENFSMAVNQKGKLIDECVCDMCSGTNVIVTLSFTDWQAGGPGKTQIEWNLCKKCHHLIVKYSIINGVSLEDAIEAGLTRGMHVLDRNKEDTYIAKSPDKKPEKRSKKDSNLRFTLSDAIKECKEADKKKAKKPRKSKKKEEQFTFEEALAAGFCECPLCGTGMSPDVAEIEEGALLHYKCNNDACGFIIKIDKGML